MRKPGTECSFEGCVEEVHAKGLCPAHHAQWYRGAPLQPIKPKTTPEERFWSNVKTGPGCWGWTGKFDEGRGRLRSEGRMVLAHVFSYELHTGRKVPEGQEIDHKCQNPSCVNPSHLRAVTRQVNAQNKGLGKRNTSGYKGVHWVKKIGKWAARVTVNGRRVIVGNYATPEEAAKAALQYRMANWPEGNKYDEDLARKFGIDYPEW